MNINTIKISLLNNLLYFKTHRIATFILLNFVSLNPTNALTSDNKLVLSMDSMFHLNDPRFVYTVQGNSIIHNTFEGLFKISDNSSNNKDTSHKFIEKAIVKTWTENGVNGKNLKFKFKLHNDRKWSNGDPVTAYDFEKSINTSISNSSKSKNLHILKHVQDAIADDQFTLTITLKQPIKSAIEFFFHRSFMPINSNLYDKYGDIWYNKTLVSNGMYVIDNYANVYVNMSLNKNYKFNKDVHFNTLQYIYNNNISNTIYKSSMKYFDISKVDNFIDIPIKDTINKYECESNKISFIAFNTQKISKHIRKSIAFAIKKNILFADKSFTPGKITDCFAYGFIDENESCSDKIINDQILLSKSIMHSLGYNEKNRLKLKYNITSRLDDKVIALMIMQMLKEIFIDIEIIVQDRSLHYSDILSNKFDFGHVRWTWDFIDYPFMLDMMHSDSYYDFSGYKNSEFDNELQNISNRADYEKLLSIEKDMLMEYPILPLYIENNSYLVNSDIQSFQCNNFNIYNIRSLTK